MAFRSDTETDPKLLSELMALSLEDRLETIARDVLEASPRYTGIAPHDLAAALGIASAEQPDGDWSFTSYATPQSVEDYADGFFPRSEIVYLIESQVDPDRFDELLERSAPLDESDVIDFSFLTSDERALIESEIMKRRLEGTLSRIAHFTVVAPSGARLRFEAVLEEYGECLLLRTPYDEKAGRFVDLTGCLTDHW